jgi:hypothetical protein
MQRTRTEPGKLPSNWFLCLSLRHPFISYSQLRGLVLPGACAAEPGLRQYLIPVPSIIFPDYRRRMYRTRRSVPMQQHCHCRPVDVDGTSSVGANIADINITQTSRQIFYRTKGQLCGRVYMYGWYFPCWRQGVDATRSEIRDMGSRSIIVWSLSAVCRAGIPDV